MPRRKGVRGQRGGQRPAAEAQQQLRALHLAAKPWHPSKRRLAVGEEGATILNSPGQYMRRTRKVGFDQCLVRRRAIAGGGDRRVLRQAGTDGGQLLHPVRCREHSDMNHWPTFVTRPTWFARCTVAFTAR